jgi:hypothetical protein
MGEFVVIKLIIFIITIPVLLYFLFPIIIGFFAFVTWASCYILVSIGSIFGLCDRPKIKIKRVKNE